MKYKTVRGMEDILPQDIRVWQHLEKIARTELESCGYAEIRTPILENTAIFTRSIGETSDIVKKEMYTLTDRKGRSLTLRPEGTAPIVRAYIEHSLSEIAPKIKRLYCIGPMFRSERPQKGRSRQFHQLGIEIIGSRSPQLDFEIIWLLNKMLRLFGLNEFSLKLNSLGCTQDKSNFRKKLKKYLENKKSKLCGDCKARLEKNVLRALDCKNDSCIQVLKNAPDIAGSLCQDCVLRFATVKAMLESEKINFKHEKNLVRGLDYYTGTIFEITHPNLGGQDAIGAGGRYDNLVKDLGGPDVGAVGFALGIERAIIALGNKKELFPKSEIICIATLGDGAKTEGFRMAEKIRKEIKGVSVLAELGNISLKSQMNNANKIGATIVIFLGENEIKSKNLTVKDMASGEQASIGEDSLIEEIKKRIGTQC